MNTTLTNLRQYTRQWRRYCLLLFAALAQYCMFSCTDEQREESEHRSGLTVVAEPMSWGSQTRADYDTYSVSGTDIHFAMTKAEGDAIGVYIVDGDGKVIVSNKPYTWNGDEWNTSSPIEYTDGMLGYKYFAYYPYRETLVGSPEMGSIVDATTASSFFADMVNGWTPLSDQGSKESFTGSDLMIAKGTVSYPYIQEVCVSFELQHQMGLLITKRAMTYYYEGSPSDTWDEPEEFVTNIPYELGSYCYYLVKPDVDVTLGSFTTSVPSGYAEQLFYTNGQKIKQDYLKFTALEDGTFSFTRAGLSYSLDDGDTWTELPAGGSTPTISAGEEVLWKNNTFSVSTGSIGTFSSTARYNVSGNILSLYSFKETLPDSKLSRLFYRSRFLSCANKLVLSSTLSTHCYEGMFYGCTSLTSAPELPAMTLAQGCYNSMFYGCTSLTSAPELPATTMERSCYNAMFYGCTSLTSAPELPAMTLAQGCYNSMFYGCTSLTSAPELPATTLSYDCYRYMFYNCSSLTSAPELPATTLAGSCYEYMFYNCTKLTSAPELPATTLANNCYHCMFYNCTKLTSAPSELPAMTLAQDCYNSMFYGCTSLTSAPSELPATTLANNCYQNMFSGCSSLTSAPELPATTLAGSCYEYMFYNCTKLTSAPELPATTLANNCYQSMFGSCTSLTTAPELPATTLANNCYHSMFSNCTKLTSAPSELPATTLATSCYTSMFSGCSSLTSAPELPATTLAQWCYASMFSGCSSLTSAPELPATTLADCCYHSMFQSCTSLTSAPELPSTTLSTSCYYNMFQSCTSLTSAPELPSTTLSTSCYYNMFQSCISLTSAPELPAMTLAQDCYNRMFNGCTSLTSAPELPATTLANNCYQYMFYGCTNLQYIKAMFLTTPGTSYTSSWLHNVKSTGTFVKNVSATWNVTGVHGIPSGWTVETATE